MENLSPPRPERSRNGRSPLGARWSSGAVVLAWCGAVLSGCSSTSAAPHENVPSGAGSAAAGASAGGGPSGGQGQGGGAANGQPEVMSKAIHRLSNLEYDNTLRDLTGTELRFADSFVNEEAEGFDNIATALSMSPRQMEECSAWSARPTSAWACWDSPAS